MGISAALREKEGVSVSLHWKFVYGRCHSANFCLELTRFYGGWLEQNNPLLCGRRKVLLTPLTAESFLLKSTRLETCLVVVTLREKEGASLSLHCRQKVFAQVNPHGNWFGRCHCTNFRSEVDKFLHSTLSIRLTPRRPLHSPYGLPTPQLPRPPPHSLIRGHV